MAAIIILAVWLIGRNAAGRLRRRIVDISSALSAAEQGRQDIKSVVTMLNSLLDIAASDLVELYSGSAEEAGIALRSIIKPDVHIMGEALQLTRLISNLLDNALKYVPRGGEISLSISEGPVIEVKDDGPGVEDAAALLIAVVAAKDARERAPLVDRLNMMNVALMDGAQDDPLTGWPAQHQSSATPFRGRTLGPAYRRERLEAGESIRIEQIFYAGQQAAIPAQASASSNVALAISNPRSEAICARNLSPRANCRWLPIFTERFAIELQNKGTTPASIYLVFR